MTYQEIRPQRPSLLAYTRCESPHLDLSDDPNVQEACRRFLQVEKGKFFTTVDSDSGIFQRLSGSKTDIENAYKVINSLAISLLNKSQPGLAGFFFRVLDKLS